MTTTYEPGAVAMVTMRHKTDITRKAETHLAFWDGYHERWVSAKSGDLAHGTTAHEVWHFDVRPLVVLDISEPTTTVDALRDAARQIFGHGSTTAMAWKKALSVVADQIEAQTKPPRIPEPGLWGVVEARIPGQDSEITFVRDTYQGQPGDADWTDVRTGQAWAWRDLIDPVLVRPGV